MLQLLSHSVSNDRLFKLSQCETTRALQDEVNQIISDLGFSMATYHLLRVNGYGDRLLTFFSTYPEEWLDRYLEKKYIFHDVVHTRAKTSVIPFSWNECFNREINDKAGLIFAEASEYRILDGFSVPIHGHGSYAVFSVVATGTKKERTESIERSRGAITLLAMHLHERAVTLFANDVADDARISLHLTRKEQECLQWIVAGKSTYDISSIMNITDHTVTFHIKSLMKKLNTNNRTQMAIRAVMLGLAKAD